MEASKPVFTVFATARITCKNGLTELPAINPNPDSFAAICKECGAGTLNNAAVECFEVVPNPFDEEGYGLQCLTCGSNRVEAVL